MTKAKYRHTLFLDTPDGKVAVHQMSTALLRFWARVNKDGPEHPTLGKCWVWGGGGETSGYGKFRAPEHIGAGERAHRHSWFIHCGEIPEGLWVLHKCDNRLCVNPDHLFLGTHEDNMEDMSRKGRSGRAKLTEDEVREIRRDFCFGSGRGRYGSNAGKLGRKYGLTSTAIRNVATGCAYRHVV